MNTHPGLFGMVLRYLQVGAVRAVSTPLCPYATNNPFEKTHIALTCINTIYSALNTK